MDRAFELAEEQLREIAATSDGTVEVQSGASVWNGYQFQISVGFDGRERVEGGLRIRAREQFLVVVPPTFPYERPLVHTPHRRFAGFAHVQWGYSLCLYRSSADWRPQDGMYGLIGRLDTWIRDAALNRLDPDDAPLHPPVAYPTVDRLVVPIADTPEVKASVWFGFAELRQRNHRTEITGWSQHHQGDLDNRAPAILLHKPLPFEYPESVNSLLKELEGHGVDYAPFVRTFASLANRSESGTPILVVLGSPMRRIEPRRTFPSAPCGLGDIGCRRGQTSRIGCRLGRRRPGFAKRGDRRRRRVVDPSQGRVVPHPRDAPGSHAAS